MKILYPAAPGSFVKVVAGIRSSLVNLFSTGPVAGGPLSVLPPRRGADDPFFAHSPIREQLERSLGTGVILDRAGHVLTALPVVQTAREIKARLPGGEVVDAQVVGTDPDTGVAVLRLSGAALAPATLTPAPLGDSGQLQVGDWVVAVGVPFGSEPYVSAGLISSPGAPRGPTLTRPGYLSFIMTDARINAANSGGPLLNVSGEVIGLCVAWGARERDVGFAVPASLLRELLPTLIQHGQVNRGWVGIYVVAAPEALARQAGQPPGRGALVSEVIQGGPADRAGIRPGDLLLEFDGRALAGHQDLPLVAARTPADQVVQVKLWRSGQLHSVSLRLERKPQ